jgi:P pilus assembly chaperone PapD
MEEVIEVKRKKRPSLIIDNSIDDSKIMFPEKLKRAQEFLAKNGLPPVVANMYAEKGVKVDFMTSGTVIQADAKENTFSLYVISKDTEIPTENVYIISTTPDILSTIVKGHWGEKIKVFLRPKAIIGQPFYYDLLEIR